MDPASIMFQTESGQPVPSQVSNFHPEVPPPPSTSQGRTVNFHLQYELEDESLLTPFLQTHRVNVSNDPLQTSAQEPKPNCYHVREGTGCGGPGAGAEFDTKTHQNMEGEGLMVDRLYAKLTMNVLTQTSEPGFISMSAHRDHTAVLTLEQRHLIQRGTLLCAAVNTNCDVAFTDQVSRCHSERRRGQEAGVR